MKKSILIILAAGAALLAASCDKENTATSTNGGKLVFSAAILDTKTTMSGVKTLWQDGDAISVYNGTDNAAFATALGSDSANADFSGTLDAAETYYAIYPVATGSNAWKDGEPRFVINSTQTAVAGNITAGYDVLAATTTDALRSFGFSHLLAALKFTVGASSGNITAIKITTDLNCCGKLKYNFGTKNYSVTDNGAAEITLQKLDKSVFEAGVYYVVLRPANYSSLAFTFTDDKEGTDASKSLSGVTLDAGTVYDMGTIAGLSFSGGGVSGPKVGDLYDVNGDSTNDGIVAYVSPDKSTGIVLSLTQSNVAYADAQTWASGLGAGWAIPSLADYTDKIYPGVNGYGLESFNLIITGAGGTAIGTSTGYWTSTEASSTHMKYFKFNNTSGDGKKTNTRPGIAAYNVTF